jgi:hypothetical protein
MEITANPVEWTSDDVANFRAFLSTQTGARLLPKVAQGFPPLMGEGDTNKILIRNGEVRGMMEAISSILALANPTAEVKSTDNNFPDLADDAAWNDGNKIQIK